MKFPGGFDMQSMMKQAQQMQEEMGKKMKETVVEASAGGSAVTVKMRGDFEVVSLVISPDLVKDGDTEMIQDLTVAALNEAHRKVEETLKGQLGGMLNIQFALAYARASACPAVPRGPVWVSMGVR